MNASWQAFYAHLCAASIIRAMPETEIPPAMRGDLYLLLQLLHAVYIYHGVSGKEQFAHRHKLIALLLCGFNERRQVFLYLVAIVVTKYYAARMQLGYHGIEYRLCAAFFFPIYGITGGCRMEQGKKC